MAKVIELSPPENAGEKLVLEYLKMNLPDPCLVLGNLTVPDPSGAAQVDAIVLGQLGLYVIEVKDWKGKLAGAANGPWQKDGHRMPNPCAQARVGSQKLRSHIRRHAKEVFGDERIFHSLDVYALLVLVDPQADTSEVKVEESKYFRVCTQLEQLLPKLHECQTESKRFLTTSDIQRMAEFLGVPKGDLATPKCPHCNAENRAGAKFCIKCGGKLSP